MDVDLLRGSPIGAVVPISGTDGRYAEPYEHWAYVPHPLPTEVDLSPATRDIVIEAALSLGRLDQAGIQIPNPAVLRRPTLRREAQSTSALEGTYAPLTEVLEADISDQAPRSPELREILNYVNAAEHAYAWVTERRLVTKGLICELHAMLMRGLGARERGAGNIRDIQVVIGAGGRISDARFVPPPPGQVLESGIADLFEWISRPQERAAAAIVNSALAHYQFETLHPFNDGNGRIGRLLVVLQLLAAEVLTEPLFAVSPWFEARRSRYQDELQALSVSGDFDRWVAFFCEGIRAQAETSAVKIRELLAFQVKARDIARAGGRHNVAVDIAGELIERPVLNVSAMASRHNVSFVSANNAVARLVERGLLTEITGRGHDRVFRCEEVIRILER